ncbi:MAG: type I restriction-modification system subunit M [Candidatus Eremiobacteraeota bacterium]|nr:type I restriction-modification system subunit M [Candidatus Eremiobacteraeota bacterium]
MSEKSTPIVQRLWNYCTVLRDDGVSYGDYVEQLTYLLFLKMADEQAKNTLVEHKIRIPDGYTWSDLQEKEGDELEVHYRHTLEKLAKERGMLGVIFRKSQNRIQDPAKLKRLVELINEEKWMAMDADIKGDIYEGLLEKNAQDIKSGAGQYFTPRTLIRAMVEVMKPKAEMTICDPACGTGGFFLSAYDYISKKYRLDRDQKKLLKNRTLHGMDIVDNVVRLCVMNLFLHGIGSDRVPVKCADSLRSHPGEYYDMILTNPPFGKKSSITIINGDGKGTRQAVTYERDDFWATTSNKQLNFLQHVRSILKTSGRAAIVVPDNVLFEGGAGETIRRKLLSQCDIHTLLRLPTGIFYAQGVKANVLFFDNRPGQEKPWTENLWIYDLRTNIHFTLKTKPMKHEDLRDFIQCYNPDNRHNRKETDRFKCFSYDELIQRDKVNLDIFWLKDESLEDSDNLPDPVVLASQIVDNLESALEQFRGICEELEGV